MQQAGGFNQTIYQPTTRIAMIVAKLGLNNMKSQSIMLPLSILKAYEQTNYCFNDIILNIGEISQSTFSILKSYTPNGGIFITAWNPLGEVATDDENKVVNQKLKLDLLSRGLIVLEGYGESSDNKWREDSYFAYPVTEQTSLELCNHYKQNAVVYVTSNGTPKLILNSMNAIQS